MNINKLWTVYSDYFATGEGRTLMAMICYAETKEEAIKKFADTFDEYFALGAEAEVGILKNSITEKLFTADIFEFAEKNEFKCNIIAQSSLHFNYS